MARGPFVSILEIEAYEYLRVRGVPIHAISAALGRADSTLAAHTSSEVISEMREAYHNELLARVVPRVRAEIEGTD